MSKARHVSVKQLPERMSLKQGPRLFREVESCLQSDRPRLVLDCSKVTQLDSAGIHVLLRCLEAAMKRNGDVKLASVPPSAAAILKLTRVDRLFEAFESTADAVNSFHGFQRRPYQQASEHAHSTLLRRGRHGSFENSQSDLRDRPAGPEAIAKTSSRLRRQIVGSLVLLLITPFAHAVPRAPQEATPSQQVTTASTAPQTQSPDSTPGDKKAAAETSQPDALPNSPGTVRSQAVDTDRKSNGQQPSPAQQQEPLGTAAAPPLKTTGVAASRPAGAAIAPAKQRRARSILIKVGAIVGAGVAVGTVVALSKASPSRPPASR
jgi:anti-sigma B factor antagonist